MAASRLFTSKCILQNYRIARRNFAFAKPRVRSQAQRDDDDGQTSKLLDRVRRTLPYACFSTAYALPRSAAPLGFENQSFGEVSTAKLETDDSVLPPVPSPPPDPPAEIEGLTFVDEKMIDTAGLGGWTPAGIIQQILEYFHVTFDLPWWGAIACLTCIFRILTLPLTIQLKRAMVKYQNELPKIQALQEKVNEARMAGNYYEVARHGQELMKCSQGLYTKDMILPYLIQAPVFVSFFFALRQMASSDLESFKTGGLWWFTDLSLPDQFYLLPLLTSATMWTTLRFGSETPFGTLEGSWMSRGKLFVEAGISGLIFVVTMKFPAAVLCYWVSTNFLTLGQTLMLKIPAVKAVFKIPPLTANLRQAPKAKMGLKQTYENWKIIGEIEARERTNMQKFDEAKSAPLQRTFKFDPTKPRPVSNHNLMQKK